MSIFLSDKGRAYVCIIFRPDLLSAENKPKRTHYQKIASCLGYHSNLVYVPGNSSQVPSAPPPCHPTHEHCKYHYSSFFRPPSPPTHCTLWQILWQGINSPRNPHVTGFICTAHFFVSVGCCLSKQSGGDVMIGQPGPASDSHHFINRLQIIVMCHPFIVPGPCITNKHLC